MGIEGGGAVGHLVAIVTLGVACALWMVVQLAAGDGGRPEGGGCGCCGRREECEPRGERRP